jgi:hypothetical protein
VCKVSLRAGAGVGKTSHPCDQIEHTPSSFPTLTAGNNEYTRLFPSGSKLWSKFCFGTDARGKQWGRIGLASHNTTVTILCLSLKLLFLFPSSPAAFNYSTSGLKTNVPQIEVYRLSKANGRTLSWRQTCSRDGCCTVQEHSRRYACPVQSFRLTVYRIRQQRCHSSAQTGQCGLFTLLFGALTPRFHVTILLTRPFQFVTHPALGASPSALSELRV